VGNQRVGFDYGYAVPCTDICSARADGSGGRRAGLAGGSFVRFGFARSAEAPQALGSLG